MEFINAEAAAKTRVGDEADGAPTTTRQIERVFCGASRGVIKNSNSCTGQLATKKRKIYVLDWKVTPKEEKR